MGYEIRGLTDKSLAGEEELSAAPRRFGVRSLVPRTRRPRPRQLNPIDHQVAAEIKCELVFLTRVQEL